MLDVPVVVICAITDAFLPKAARLLLENSWTRNTQHSLEAMGHRLHRAIILRALIPAVLLARRMWSKTLVDRQSDPPATPAIWLVRHIGAPRVASCTAVVSSMPEMIHCSPHGLSGEC